MAAPHMSGAECPLARKRIGLLTAWASRAGGGVFEAVAAQATLLRSLGAVPVVIALEDESDTADAGRLAGVELHRVRVLGPRFLGYAPRLGKSLDRARLDLLHLHGIWMYPSQAASAWAARTGRPLLTSPHGMLDPWITARGHWKKALARAGYERRAWRRASGFHALTPAEAMDIARESGRDESFVIPNAGPEPRHFSPRPRELIIAYLGRVHPKKNIAALIDAWDRLAATGALSMGARLDIAGWGEPAHLAVLEARLRNAHETVRFLGPCFGAGKAELLARARFLALPSLSEGLPMTVLEAWASGTPMLMSQHCHLPDGFASGAAIDCGTTPETIARALTSALGMEHPRWLEMSKAALALADGPYASASVARQWESAYAALINGGSAR